MDEDKDLEAVLKIVRDMLYSPDENGTYPMLQTAEQLAKIVMDARVETLGWAYADCCVTLDRGGDPRKTNMPGVLERMKRDLVYCPEAVEPHGVDRGPIVRPA